jgi:signal peptidase I
MTRCDPHFPWLAFDWFFVEYEQMVDATHTASDPLTPGFQGSAGAAPAVEPPGLGSGDTRAIPAARVPPRHFRFRAVVESVVRVTVALTVIQTWLLDGLAPPFRISGGSMAETLRGAHRDLVCADCGYPFSCGVETPPIRPNAVCPNCDYAGNDLASQVDLAGDLAWLDRASFHVRRPRRWELAAFLRPDHADEIALKRVVGLPGESVQIRDGNVWIDGHIRRKNLAEQHATAILVHDARYEPTIEPRPPRRWRSDDSDTRWDISPGRFSHPADDAAGAIDWLTYHHGRRLPGVPGKVIESPITDVFGYNVSQSRRAEDIHAVPDILLSVRVADVQGRGLLAFYATDGVEEFEAHLYFDGGQSRYQVFQAGHAIAGVGGDFPLTAGKSPTVEVSLVDQQFLLAFDGETVATWPYELTGAPSPPATPVAIGVQGLTVVLTDICLYRDISYTHPIGLERLPGMGCPVHLGDDEYFVLGDNSPISADSRTWSASQPVSTNLLIGKPLGIVVPAGYFGFGSRHFQVPNLGRIRYIR